MEEISLLVLAGGRSRRMRQDKLWMALDGVPLVERTVRRVLPLADEVLLGKGEALPSNSAQVGADAERNAARLEALAAALRGEGIAARVVADIYPGAGPLAGLHAGLAAARNDLLLALAADMPFVNLALIEEMLRLAEGFDAVVPLLPLPEGALAWEPLHALYRRSCLTAVTVRLAAGERRVNSFLPELRVRAVMDEEFARYDPGRLSIFNVNTPEDWLVALRLAPASAPRVKPSS